MTDSIALAKEQKDSDAEQSFEGRLKELISSSTDFEQLRTAFAKLNAKAKDVDSVSSEFLKTSGEILEDLNNKMTELTRLTQEKPAAGIVREIQNIGHVLGSMIAKPSPNEVKKTAEEGGRLLSSVDVNSLSYNDLKNTRISIKEAVKPAEKLKEMLEKTFGKESLGAKSLSSFIENAKGLMAKIGKKILPTSIQKSIEAAKVAKETAVASKSPSNENKQGNRK